jgi:lipopolysaccharide biosynthesis glycosyltransferase
VKYTIPLVIAFTPNYFIPAAVCLLSILKHSEEADKFHVIVLLSEELPDEMKQKLRKLGGGRMDFSFLNLEGKLTDIYVDPKYTVAASYRLLLPELLPEYDKVVYIDCDVAVRNNLAELYRKLDLDGNYLAAIFEAPLDSQLPHLKAIGCEPGHYFNSGFLVMNLKKMREDGMSAKFIEASKADYLEFPDQDVLNQLCKGHVIGLPPYYNSIRTFFLPQYKKEFLKYYTEKDWADLQNHGTVHYTGTKPWNSFAVRFEVWWRYFEQLPAEIKRHADIDKKTYRLFKIYNTLPGRILIKGVQDLYRKVKY